MPTIEVGSTSKANLFANTDPLTSKGVLGASVFIPTLAEQGLPIVIYPQEELRGVEVCQLGVIGKNPPPMAAIVHGGGGVCE